MQEKQLFEYAIIRVVPKVERGEFINIGVVLYCARLKFLGAEFDIDEKRLTVFTEVPVTDDLKEYVRVFCEICKGGNNSGPIGQLPMAERFRWLTATRSTVLQSSPVHNGLTSDGQEELNRLFQALVL
jgi:Protein of unknown function (DUF3037)